MRPKLFLIDGTAIIFRSYFAFIRNPLYNSKGENTGAIYGTISFFLRMLERFKPEYIAISFDKKEKTFRHKITDTYKANRPPAPDELNQQVEPIKEFFRLINLPEISMVGFEADDTLATLAERNKNDFDIVIVSGDKDFCQLVDDKVVLYDPAKDILVDYDKVVEKYGVTPSQFVDWLAICGDSADNIPGVRGIGPKGATKLLSQFSSLEEIYNNIDKISSKSIKKKLEESKDNAFLSKKLAKIVIDVPLDIAVDRNFKFFKTNLVKSKEFLQKYELTSILKKIEKMDIFESQTKESQNDVVEKVDEMDFDTVTVNDEKSFNKLLIEIEKHDEIALDTETTSKDPFEAELVGISICFNEKKAYYISIAHFMEENLDKDYVLKNLKIVLASKLIIAHNFKYDYQVLKMSGWKIENPIFDTIIADYLLSPRERHSLDACALRNFDYTMLPISHLIGKGKKQTTFDLVPLVHASFYSAEDAFVTFKLYKLYKPLLKEKNLDNLFYSIEIPLISVLAKMEYNGVLIDKKMLLEISKTNQKKLSQLRDEIYEIAGSQFNLNSSQQLSKILFDVLKIKPTKKTKTGFSTDMTVLEELSKEHEIAKLLMEYRQITKLESTYIKALPRLIKKSTGRIHSSFNQTIATTGRLSSSNPNLQNIPVRSEMGKEIRKAFIAPKGYKLISADYSQIELRLLAILSKDSKMIAAFNSGLDIHSKTASIIFDKDIDDITKDNRRFAKIINFGLIYGMGAYRISKELDISQKEAKQFIENYFNQFPTIKDYIDNAIKDAKERGFVSTILGRRLYLPDLNSSSKRAVAEAERVAINMPIQGSAADIIKFAMINIHNKIKNDDRIKMIIQIHDELIFEVKDSFLEEAKKLINDEMGNALPKEYKNIVQLLVDIGVGENWLEAH